MVHNLLTVLNRSTCTYTIAYQSLTIKRTAAGCRQADQKIRESNTTTTEDEFLDDSLLSGAVSSIVGHSNEAVALTIGDSRSREIERSRCGFRADVDDTRANQSSFSRVPKFRLSIPKIRLARVVSCRQTKIASSYVQATISGFTSS